MLHLLVLCMTPNQRQEAFRVFFFFRISHVCSNFLDVQDAISSASTAVPNRRSCRLMHVHGWTVYQRFNFGNAYGGLLTCEPARSNSRLERHDSDSNSHSHPETCAFDNMFKLYVFEDNAAVIQKMLNGRSRKLRHFT